MSPINSARLRPSLIRLAKVTAAAAVAAVLGFLAGPDVAGVVGVQNAVIVTMILTPILSAVEKALTLPK